MGVWSQFHHSCAVGKVGLETDFTQPGPARVPCELVDLARSSWAFGFETLWMS